MRFFIAWLVLSAILYVIIYLQDLAFEELRYLIKGEGKRQKDHETVSLLPEGESK